MKKLIIISLIFVSFIIIFNMQNYNKKYINYDKNIYIEYPNTNDDILNNELNTYIDSFINNYDYLFIDYDYISNNTLTMYIYKEKDNITKSLIKTFNIKTTSQKDNYNYDIYNWQVINKNKLIALTFDDGPNHNTSKVLDVLEKYNIKATFFILGTNIKGNEKIIKRMNNLEMEIGNHFYSHKITTRLKKEQLKEEIDKTDKLIYDIIKEYPTLIRPSYGIYNNKLKNIIDRPIVLWNIDTLDWKYHNSRRIANKVFNNLYRGNIILMHDIYNATANSLEIIIPKLLENNYKFVTVSELLYYESYSLK